MQEYKRLQILSVAAFILFISNHSYAEDSKPRRSSGRHSKQSTRSTKRNPEPEGRKLRAKVLDAQLNLGMDSVKFADSSQALTGLGYGVVAHYRLSPAPTIVLPLGGGLRMSSVAATSGGFKLEINVTTMRLDLSAAFVATPQFHIGAFLGYDVLLSGSAKFSGSYQIGDKEQSFSSSTKISSLSQTVFGVRGVYLVDNQIFLGGDYGVANGSYRTDGGESAISFTGSQINALVGMLF